jgi:hypothetical protein
MVPLAVLCVAFVAFSLPPYLLWVPVTIAGYRAARQRRFVEHRVWMIRSFALTASIVVNRLWLVALLILLAPRTGSAFGGDEAAMVDAAAAASV